MDSIVRTLLFACVLFLGFQLFFGQNQRPTDTRTAEQILGKMREQNRKLLDTDILRERQAYLSKLNAQKLEPDAKLRQEVEAWMLVVHTEFQGGVQLDNYERINKAFTTLQEKREWLQAKPLWKQTFEVARFEGKPGELRYAGTETLSPDDLYNRVTADLRGRAENHLIMGVVPGYAIMDFLVGTTGAVPGFSYAFAAFLLALLVRLVVWPLAHKQYLFGRKMGQLAPLIRELKGKYEKLGKNGKPLPLALEDQQALQQDTMKLYKEYGVNPMAGCAPAMVQLPLFLLVYQFMVDYRFEFTKGVFLWIHPNPGSLFGLIPIAPNLGERDILLITLYAITVLVSTLMTPVSDPTQARQQRLMGVVISVTFTVFLFFWPVPAAFALYWTFTNILSMIQIWLAYRAPLPPLVKVNAPNGAVVPFDPNLNGSTTYLGKTGTPKSHRSGKSKRK